MWKLRFRCLQRGLTNKLSNVVPIICATAVLHNIAQKCNEVKRGGDDSDDDDEAHDDDDNLPPTPVIAGPTGTVSGN